MSCFRGDTTHLDASAALADWLLSGEEMGVGVSPALVQGEFIVSYVSRHTKARSALAKAVTAAKKRLRGSAVPLSFIDLHRVAFAAIGSEPLPRHDGPESEAIVERTGRGVREAVAMVIANLHMVLALVQDGV